MARVPKWPLVLAILVVTIGSDQLTKEWATNRLSGGRSIGVLPTVEFDLAYNSGFSFSTGDGNGQLVGILVVAVCLFILWQIHRETLRARVVLFAVILGGALGNVTDRLFRADDGILTGEVIDFIDVSWYAVFNVADSFVVCGCIAFIVNELRMRRAAERDDEENGDPLGEDAAAMAPKLRGREAR